ncbi:MAG: hypothetical protein HY881_21285 [Deltaproteobacteria bacterium]|nr:hypothetical protein [Deltaproteobacteria bacterium]
MDINKIVNTYLIPAINDAKKKTGKDKVLIISHSMGGGAGGIIFIPTPPKRTVKSLWDTSLQIGKPVISMLTTMVKKGEAS